MTDFYFADRLFLRIPYYSKNSACLPSQQMLDDPAFRRAIFLASDVVYDELVKTGFRWDACSVKLKLALARYQKRMHTRPTPFGAFAGIAVVGWAAQGDGPLLIGQTSFRTLLQFKETIDHPSVVDTFRVNPLLYPYGTDYRMLVSDTALPGAPPVFSISEFHGQEPLRKLCSMRQPISKGRILAAFNGFAAPLKMFKELQSLQLLVPGMPDHKPPVIEFTSAAAQSPGSAFLSCSTVSALAGVPRRVEPYLRHALACLQKISHIPAAPAINAFRNDFQKRFDRREVPLMHALDPELGVGYPEPANFAAPTSPWSALHELMLSKWTCNGAPVNEAICLSDSDLESLPVSDIPAPPGQIMMFSMLSKGILISAAGGVSALNTISRFTVFDDGTSRLAEDLASAEQQHNPDVIFAEVIHNDGPRAASVNNRKIFWQYQILLSGRATTDQNFILQPSDLLLSVQNGQLMLRSKRLGKRVIPRFSTAYNYQLSTLPVFRFLCDLQYEGTGAGLGLNMPALFPGLPFYPRVVYKDVVLSAASWHVRAVVLKEILKMQPAAQYNAFMKLAREINLPSEVCYVQHDQLLHVDTALEPDVSLFLKSIDSSSGIVLREYFPEQQLHVRDQQGNAYAHELIAFVLNKKSSYKGFAAPQLDTAPRAPKFFPFNEWIYIKVYLHPAGYREMLANMIGPYIGQVKAKALVSSWFFVCYSENGHHLRIRLRQRPGKDTAVLESLKRLQSALCACPNVQDVDFATYSPEMERYAAIGIDAAEQLFMLSSEMVLRELNTGTMESDRALLHAVGHAYKVFAAAGYSDSCLLGCISGFVVSNLLNRHALNEAFRRLRQPLREAVRPGDIHEQRYFSLIAKLVSPLEQATKLTICADLIHMHLNRFFLYDQPKLEKDAWYLLAKTVRSLISYPLPCVGS